MSIEYTPRAAARCSPQHPHRAVERSSDPDELRQSISYGGVGATCNPTIAYNCIIKRKDFWNARIAEIAKENPTISRV